MDIFGSRWGDYHNKIEAAWKATVSGSDTVVIAGDVSWAMSLSEAEADFRYLEALPGIKLLGKGNHDYWWDTVSKMTAFLDRQNLPSIKFLYNNAYAIDGIAVCGSRGWFINQKNAPDDSDYKKIVAREAGRIEASIIQSKKSNCEPVVFLHFPPVYKSFICREIIDVLQKHGVKRCYYGHIHSEYDTDPSFIFEDIEFIITSADYLNFTPLKIERGDALGEPF